MWGAALTGLLFSGALNVVGYFIGKVVVESAGTLRIVEAIGFGYLLAGLHRVLCDLRQSLIGRPAYIRAGSTSIQSLTLGLLGWLPVSVFNLRTFLDTIFSWVTFVVVTCALLLL